MNRIVPDDSGWPTPSEPELTLDGRLQSEPDQVAEATSGVVLEPVADEPTVISQRPAAMQADFVRSLSLVELAKSLEGRSLHHFSVERMIGGGGMGAVFRGRDQRLDREVAIKVIPESRRDSETLRRFRMEAQSAARLDHPNIARVYDIGEDEAWNYIVFEYIEGINLRDLVLTNGPMSVDDAVFTTRQVAEALEHAHSRDVVHRDIKPSNVIITSTGIAKVVDMGLARNTAMDRSTADQTASGVTLGTFDYISPEQARDPRDADVRSDLYSLGCTLFYMLTGQPPFPEGTALQKLLNHGSQPPPDPRQWREDISDQLAAVLSKLMAKRPADRYQKPIELINDLLLIAQIEHLPRSRSAGTILMQPSIARRSLLETHLPWLIPLSVLVGSAIWLQSAESWTAPLEIPQPTLTSAQSRPFPAAPPNAAPVLPSSLREGTPSAIREETVPSPPASQAQRATDMSGSDQLSNQPVGQPANPSAGAPASISQPFSRQSAPEPMAGSTLPLAASLNSLGSSPTGSNPVGGVPTPASALSSTQASSTATTPTSTSAVKATGTSTANQETTTVQPSRTETAADSSDPSLEPEFGSKSESARTMSAYVASAEVIRVGGSVTESLGNLARWAPNLPAALMQVAMQPDIRVIELHESVELTSAISLPRSGLTLRAAAGVQPEIVLSGADAFGMGWEAWIDVDRKQLRCQGLRIVCMNDMRQPQAVFALRNGGRIELDECQVTMLASRDTQLGSCVLIKESPRTVLSVGSGLGQSAVTVAPPTLMPSTSPTTLMPTAMPPLPPAEDNFGDSFLSNSGPGSLPPTSSVQLSGSDDQPVSIAIRNSIVRGAQTLITMRNATRAEITIEKVCAMLEGRVLTIRQAEQDRTPPVVRVNLLQSTFVTNLGFLALIAPGGDRAPMTLMRTARLCVFWSPITVPHISIDALENEKSLEKVLLLRGEENAYDANIETLCQCRFSDGQLLDLSLLDGAGDWFKELGNELDLSWLDSVPPERPMHDQLPVHYRLRDSMFMPGYNR